MHCVHKIFTRTERMESASAYSCVLDGELKAQVQVRNSRYLGRVLIGTRNLDWLKLPPAIFPEPKYLAHDMDSGEFLSTYVEITSDRVPHQRMRFRRVQVSEGTLTADRENPRMEPSPWLCASFFCRIVYCN